MGTFQQRMEANRTAAVDVLGPGNEGLIASEERALTSIARSVINIEIQLASIAVTLRDIQIKTTQ